MVPMLSPMLCDHAVPAVQRDLEAETLGTMDAGDKMPHPVSSSARGRTVGLSWRQLAGTGHKGAHTAASGYISQFHGHLCGGPTR